MIDGRPAYSTSDLVEQHPTKPHLFRVFGRADDQLMLSTGEKVRLASDVIEISGRYLIYRPYRQTPLR